MKKTSQEINELRENLVKSIEKHKNFIFSVLMRSSRNGMFDRARRSHKQYVKGINDAFELICKQSGVPYEKIINDFGH